MHGINTRERYNPGSHLDLRGWYARKRKERLDNEIRNILRSRRETETAGMSETHALPPGWGHKAEALSGDTVYLGHNNDVRSFVLSAQNKVEPGEGKVSVVSPIGMTLLGKHQGDKVHLMTLDGDLDYTILKIL